MLNVYKIHSKDHLVAHSSAGGEISVFKTFLWKYLKDFPLFLRNNKTLKSTNINRFTTSSILCAQ